MDTHTHTHCCHISQHRGKLRKLKQNKRKEEEEEKNCDQTQTDGTGEIFERDNPENIYFNETGSVFPATGEEGPPPCG